NQLSSAHPVRVRAEQNRIHCKGRFAQPQRVGSTREGFGVGKLSTELNTSPAGIMHSAYGRFGLRCIPTKSPVLTIECAFIHNFRSIVDYSAEAAGNVAERTLTAASSLGGSTLNSISQDLATGQWTKVVEVAMELGTGLTR